MASTYTQLKKGSQGNEVNALQTELSKKGYALQNTGLFDDATEAAVKKYQQDSGLTVDGIAGDATLGSLYGTNNQSAMGGYTPSAQLVEAQKYAQSVAAQKPAEYQSPLAGQLQAQFEAIMNRQPFSYDLGSDAGFQQMSDMYVQQGRRAMQDTMGQAAEMTGGYANSYAQGVGQAAYGNYLQKLGALAPEYEQQAYARWQNAGADMVDRYNMMAAQEEQGYGRYMDALNNYWAEADRAQQAADKLYDREFEQHSVNRDYAYNTALMMLQGGKMPSTDVLAMAGISQADAATIMDMYKPKKSSGNKKTETTDQVETTDKVQQNLAKKKAGKILSLQTSPEWVDAGVLSSPEWGEIRDETDPFYAAQKAQTLATLPMTQGYKADPEKTIVEVSKNNTEEYQTDYVEKEIERLLDEGLITTGEAKYLAYRYLKD